MKFLSSSYYHHNLFISSTTLPFLLFIQISLAQNDNNNNICTTDTNTFTTIVDLYAGALGYYTFEECPNLINPTIGLEIGQTYTFLQYDRSNWFHPIGFAYYPDGAHDDKDELEPVITQTDGNTCTETFTCPSPNYYRDDVFLGVNGTEDFGLDVYEPEFFANPAEWTAAGKYSIQLTFNDENYDKDIFYFCHIHQYMSGRIKLLKEGVPVSTADEPPLGYEYDQPGEYDATCGTYGLDSYQLPNPYCPDKFVCDADETIATYSSCIDAMNCAMLSGMTTGVKANSPVALFIHQMVPHHENAVNMAKVLLKENVLQCDDLSDEENQDCIMEVMLREIVNTQNHQIQKMLAYLKEKGIPEKDDCVVEIQTVRDTEQLGLGDNSNKEATTNNNGDITTTTTSNSVNTVSIGLSLLLPLFITITSLFSLYN